MESLENRGPTPPAPQQPSLSRPVRRLWLHGLLLAATCATAAIAGSLFWGGGAGPFDVLGGVPYAIWLVAILGAHEMGHYLACRRYGIPATLPFFLPSIPPLGTFGAVIRIRGPIPNRKALFDVAAAGPIAGFVVALPVLVAGLLRAQPAPPTPEPGTVLLGEPLLSLAIGRLLFGPAELRIDSLYGAGWVGMLVTSMNLFPVGQLDGGHAAYALSRRLHGVLSYGTIVAMGALVIRQTWIHGTPSVYSLWLIVLLFLRNRHPRLTDEGDRLGHGRIAVAILLAVIFVASFIPLPFLIVGF